ncbi:hypothetical protein BD770DRAFT_296071, partial [Pilaira anomala]
YDINEDILNKYAKISVAQLMHLIPAFKKTIRTGIREVRNYAVKAIEDVDMNVFAPIESNTADTTAAFTEVNIGSFSLPSTLIDCGACRSILSETAMRRMGLEIDKPSKTVFIVGNKQKAASLGLI